MCLINFCYFVFMKVLFFVLFLLFWVSVYLRYVFLLFFGDGRTGPPARLGVTAASGTADRATAGDP